MTLGELIDRLHEFNDVVTVRVGGGPVHLYPDCSIRSYRGVYEDLALGVTLEHGCCVRQLLDVLEGAVGETFTGYKGGEFVMTRDTRVWLANYGCLDGAPVEGVSPLLWVDQPYVVDLTWERQP